MQSLKYSVLLSIVSNPNLILLSKVILMIAPFELRHVVWTFTQGHLNTEQDTDCKNQCTFDISSFKHWRMIADVLLFIFVDYEAKNKNFFPEMKMNRSHFNEYILLKD